MNGDTDCGAEERSYARPRRNTDHTVQCNEPATSFHIVAAFPRGHLFQQTAAVVSVARRPGLHRPSGWIPEFH